MRTVDINGSSYTVVETGLSSGRLLLTPIPDADKTPGTEVSVEDLAAGDRILIEVLVSETDSANDTINLSSSGGKPIGWCSQHSLGTATYK